METILRNARIFTDGEFIFGDLYINDSIISKIEKTCNGRDFARGGAACTAVQATDSDHLSSSLSGTPSGSLSSSLTNCPLGSLSNNSSCYPSNRPKEIDLNGLTILPGLVDIHTHGALGLDFSTASEEELTTLLEFYATHGTTTVLATTMTDSVDNISAACRRISAYSAASDYSGNISVFSTASDYSEDISAFCTAHIAGINLEGPFLSEAKRGAHDILQLRDATEDEFALYEAASQAPGFDSDLIRLITIAPEREGALDFISRHAEICSLGHTACSYDTALEAFRLGVSHVTHLFNAMPEPGHRAPGLVGAAFDAGSSFNSCDAPHRGICCELICDGLHVHPSAIRTSFKCLPGQIALISDSIRPTGLEDGSYIAGGLHVQKTGEELRLEDGTLAGSGITLLEGLRRCISFGIDEKAAIHAATDIPAVSVGIDNICGKLLPGRCADLLVTDSNYALQAVFLRGLQLR